MQTLCRLILTCTLITGCDEAEQLGQPEPRDLDLGPGCAYDVHHDGPTGCVQDAALCYADLATFCEFDFFSCYLWSEWCAAEVQLCLKHAANE